MGEDEKDGDKWLPPTSGDSGSLPPPGAPEQGDVRWGAPAPPPAAPLESGQPTFHPQEQVAPQGTSGKATASLVMGILGLLLCPWICAILALVFGYQARKEIDNSGGRLGNRGLAIAGIVLGWIGIVYAIGITIYIITQLGTPDANNDGVPDGLQVIVPILVGAVSIASTTFA